MAKLIKIQYWEFLHLAFSVCISYIQLTIEHIMEIVY